MKNNNNNMIDRPINIDGAITHFNIYKRKINDPLLDKKTLAPKVITDVIPAVARNYLSDWNKGKRLTRLKPIHIKRICDITGFSKDDLFLYYND